MAEERQARWATRFGFYLAAVGSAFGLGNIWRFPYVVAENGGGAFVFVYLALVFVVGMPFLVGELLLGKVTGSAIVPAMRRIGEGRGNDVASATTAARSRMVLGTGYLAIALCLLVFSYYSVISGWVLHFLVRFLIGALVPGEFMPREALGALLKSGWLQLMLASAHMIVVMVAVLRGVEDGIERWVRIIMPFFFVLVVILAFRSLAMDSAEKALRFFFYPDFSKLEPAGLGRAIGQVCFTLSVGFGTMVTFGSYMTERMSAAVAGFRVAIFDSVISLVAGVMIFPLVFSGEVSESVGPTLLFETVPFLFAKLPGGVWFGLAFFICLYLAAVGASIGLLETAVANLRETRRWSRQKATQMTVVAAFFAAVVPALATSVLGKSSIGGTPLLEAWDGLLINWLLPIVAVLVSQIVVRRMDREIQRAEFESVPVAAMGRLYEHWSFAIRYLAPILCVIGLILQLL